jgi:hypothetical protein
MSSQCHLKCIILFHKCWVINNKQDMHDVMLQILSSLWDHITRLQTLTSYYKVTNTDIILQSYKHWQCITRLQTLTMYYKVTNTDMYYKVTNTDIILQGTNTDNVLFCGNLICIPVLKEMLFMVANKKSWHPFLHI